MSNYAEGFGEIVVKQSLFFLLERKVLDILEAEEVCMEKERIYISIDLKSFYASVECIERGLNPLDTNLVVADASRTQKTICLAVSPALKAWGIPGRPRLFEVQKKVQEANALRMAKVSSFTGASVYASELMENPNLKIDYLVARPRMAYYIEYSTRIYKIYLKYIASEDIHVYSIDEVFLDVTDYLQTYQKTPKELAQVIIHDILKTTGITATAGIGTNLYLCKVAMDILAKKATPDENGVRIAQLDELEYRKQLWNHRPLTDFWRVGKGYAKKLEAHAIYTMGDIARCSIGKANEYHNEELLYQLFGVNAELLIDHAWGWEPCTMQDIKSYRPENNSIGSGQVLHCPYEAAKAQIVTKEMTELLVLDLISKKLLTDQLVLTVGYDIENLQGSSYTGPVKEDMYGRKIPKHAHGTINLEEHSNSSMLIINKMMQLYNQIVNHKLLVRRITISFNHVIKEEEKTVHQMNLFELGLATEEKPVDREKLEKERKLQEAVLQIKGKYGKNAILKGMNLLEGSTAKERNEQIGGHHA